MNVFALDADPARAAGYLCTLHRGKMLLESVQLLCTAAPPGPTPYKRTHPNHPCTAWLRGTPGAWGWLVAHARELARLHEAQRGKPHASATALEEVAPLGDCSDTIPSGFALAMPVRLRTVGGVAFSCAPPELAVRLYRDYYRAKAAEWASEGRPMRWYGQPPEWWARETTRSPHFRLPSPSSRYKVFLNNDGGRKWQTSSTS